MQKICIIVPCYNEADRINVDSFVDFFKSNDYHVCFVNDGSKDNTLTVLENLKNKIGSNCDVLNLTKNGGKAEAIRQGIINIIDADFDYIGFFDADLATPLSEINYFIKFCDGKLKHDIIMGSRFSRLGADIKRTTTRHYIGRVFSTLASLILNLKVYDTQCGAKLFSRKIYEKVFNDEFISKWIFDIEILFRAIRIFGLAYVNKNTIEIPLNKWSEKNNSKLKWSDFIKVPFELFVIWKSFRTKKA